MISQFAEVVMGAGGSGEVPGPAASIVGVLGAANLDLLGFVPLDCMLPTKTNYYHNSLSARPGLSL